MFAIFCVLVLVFFGVETNPEMVSVWSMLLSMPVVVSAAALLFNGIAAIIGISSLEKATTYVVNVLFSGIDSLNTKTKGVQFLYFQEYFLSVALVFILSEPLHKAKIPNILECLGFGFGVIGLSFATLYFYNLRKKVLIAG